TDRKPVPGDESHRFPINQYNWSPDSKWIAYGKANGNTFGQIFLYSLDQRKSTPVTDGMTNDRAPVFDLGGKYLYFLGDRNYLPSLGGFELNMNFANTTGIYAVTLAADTPSPFAPESDEEKPAPGKTGEGDQTAKDKEGEPKPLAAGEGGPPPADP